MSWTVLPKIEREKSRGEKLTGAIGQGLEAFSKLYQQGKEKKALADKYGKDVANLPPEERKLAVANALKGQQEGATAAQKLQRDTAQKRQLEKDRNLPEGSLENYDIKTAEQASRPQKDKNKTQAAQPIDPQQLKAIEDVTSQEGFYDLSPEEQNIKLLKGGVSKENAKPILDLAVEKNKIKSEEKKITRSEELQFHKESQGYDEELIKQTKIAKRQVETFKDIDKALDSGNVKPTAISNILRAFGPIGELASKAFLTEDAATLRASIPGLLEGWKEVFGVRLSDADLKLLQDKLPDMGNSVEANRAILKVMKKYGKMTLLRSQIAQEIKEKNNGLRPLDYAGKIEKKFDEMVTPVKMINPKNNNVLEIPAYEVSGALNAGLTIYNEDEDNG
jgi:hypothetical protein